MKILSLLFCLFLIQSVLSKPIDDSSEESSEEVQAILAELQVNGTNAEKLILSRMGNYMLIPQNITAKAANASKHLLKDEALMAENSAEALEFKKNLTMFLEKYNPAANLNETHETMAIFVNTTAHYFELDEEKITPENKFILKLLNKYSVKDLAINLDDVEVAIDEWRITGSAADKVFLFIMDGLITIPQQYAANATNATQYLLKDEALKDNLKPEVEEFKQKLNMYLKKYDPTTSIVKSTYDSMDIFNNITASYYQRPVDKVTEESKFIVQLLNKYNCKNYSITFVNYITTFLEEFKQIFEEFKEDLEQPILGWYDEFVKQNNIYKKMIALNKLIGLLRST